MKRDFFVSSELIGIRANEGAMRMIVSHPHPLIVTYKEHFLSRAPKCILQQEGKKEQSDVPRSRPYTGGERNR